MVLKYGANRPVIFGDIDVQSGVDIQTDKQTNKQTDRQTNESAHRATLPKTEIFTLTLVTRRNRTHTSRRRIDRRIDWR